MEINEQHKKLFKRAYELLIKESDSFATNPYKVICDLVDTIPTIEAYYGCLEDIISACGADTRKKASFTLFPLTDSTFNINLKKRTITSPKNQQVSVEGDKLSTTIIFTVDRYYELIDLAQDVDIKIYYQTKETMGAVKCYTVNLIDDINFIDKIRFGWVLDDTYILNSGKDLEFFISFEKKLNRILNETLVTTAGKIGSDGKVNTSDTEFEHTATGIAISAREVLKLNQIIDDVECYYSTSSEANTSDALAEKVEIELNNQQYTNDQDQDGYFFFNIPANITSDLKYTIINAEHGWRLNTLLQEIRVENKGFDTSGMVTSINVPIDYDVIPNSSESIRGYVASPIFISNFPEKVTLKYNKPVTLKVIVEDPDEGVIKYKWKKNGIEIGDANSNSYTIEESGSYNVTAQTVISAHNMSEEEPSSTVVASYEKVEQPIFLTNLPSKIISDEDITLSVTAKASAEGTIKYQWYKNGEKLNDETIYSTLEVTPTDTIIDSYRVDAYVDVGDTNYNSEEKPSTTVKVSKTPVCLTGGSNNIENAPFDSASGVFTLASGLTVPTGKLTEGTKYTWYYSKTKNNGRNLITSSTPWVKEGVNSATLQILKNSLSQFLYIWCEGKNIANGEKSPTTKSKTFIVSP